MSQRNLGRWGLLLIGILGLLAISSASALAAGPPIVTVNAASNLRLNTATGSGTVDKNGAANSTVKIEYGKSKLYGQSVTLPNVTATGAVSVSEIITGLEPLATYHYRISATNSFGTTVSEDVQFEQQLQWKVAGKTLSELAYGPVSWDGHSGEWALTGEGTLGGNSVKFSCEADYRGAESDAHGKLGVSYSFPLKGCKFFAKGKEVPACKPASSMTVEADGLLQTTSATSVKLGEECAFGESLALPKGYGIGPISEAVRPGVTLLGHAGSLNFSITNPDWELGGAYLGLAFGIS